MLAPPSPAPPHKATLNPKPIRFPRKVAHGRSSGDLMIGRSIIGRES